MREVEGVEGSWGGYRMEVVWMRFNCLGVILRS
jgi:hypothetical protein